MRTAARISSLPRYLFAELDEKVAAKRAAGEDVISLGIGDPDLPTPRHVVEALQEAAEDPATHQYPSYYGLPSFRAAIADLRRCSRSSVRRRGWPTWRSPSSILATRP